MQLAAMPRTRYFLNPYQQRPLPVNTVDSKWLRDKTELLLKTIGEAKLNRTSCIYVGLAGIAFAYLQAAKLFPERKVSLVTEAQRLCQYHLDHLSKDESAFLLGNLGVYTISALVMHQMNDGAMNQMVDRCVSVAQSMLPIDFRPEGGDEMLVGRAGFLCAILNLRQTLNMPIISDQLLTSIIGSMLNSGRVYSARYRHRTNYPPLMYAYHGTEYLGAAHGLSSILQLLISFPKYLNDKDMIDVRTSIDWLLQTQTTNGNFPCAVDEIGHNRGDADELVHWCHGAPGVIYLMARAYYLFRDEKYLQACIRCADLIWQKGLLRKGAGICHGVTGNAYAFLLLYQLTHDVAYLTKAQSFAHFIFTREFVENARTPDSPFSLFEGYAGAVCFFVDLAYSPQSAVFPLFPIFFD